MELIFIQLAIILLTAFLVSFIIRLFNQPIIIGYIIAGVLISPFIVKFVDSQEIISVFSHLGIAFLLFIVGLHLNPNIIKKIGKTSLIIGIGQIILTFILGFLVSTKLLGYNTITSFYVGIALMFSSTIIVTKLLSDKKEIDSLYGKLSIGILIVQDLVAVGVLMVISSMNGNAEWSSFASRTLIGGGGSLILLFLIGYFVLPKLVYFIAKSQELLFLFSICWCFLVASLFSYLGFSMEIGALIAGVVLSISPYTTEISSKVRPLRDFFLIIFFIILGFNISLPEIKNIIFPALILSLVGLIFKPIIIMFIMMLFGHTKRNNFLVGTTLAQISEFSLIILTLGVSLGQIDKIILSTLTLTGIITIAFSSYFIIYSVPFYNKLSGFISFFEKKRTIDQKEKIKEYNTILFGYNRIGFGILKSIQKLKKSYLVVDFNPDTIDDLRKLRIPAIYGDVSDSEFLDALNLKKVELAVSTIPDFETNLVLIEALRLANSKSIIIVRAHQISDALELYKRGANYVLTPHFLGGEYISNMIHELKTEEKEYTEEREKHIAMLKGMLKKGIRHPDVERN
jgi:Kef-type K+ transport system membrane component KefB